MPRDLVLQQVDLTVQEMARGLAPLRPDLDDNFEHVLQNLIKQSARLGLALFTIPERWVPVWTLGDQQDSQKFVIFPGIRFVTRKNGATRDLTEPYLQ